PEQFQCAPGAPCFPREWRCDGHPDCEDDGDEWDCGTATAVEPRAGGPAVTPLSGSAAPPAGSAGTGPRMSEFLLVHSPGLLIVLVAAGSVSVWVLSKAKRRSDTFSVEKASREQLMPDKSQ
ncbi:RSVR protein, partial [Spelaeornis formosus]|nr:RSVR protein [Elachura formosa]